MRRLAFALAAAIVATPLMATAAAPERWLEVSAADETHGRMALNLGSVHPSATKGLDDAVALEVKGPGAVFQNRYEVRCGRGLIHTIERHGVDAKTGKLTTSEPVIGEWARPDGAGEKNILAIVCRDGTPGGDVISDKRAMIWLLSRPAPPAPPAA
jgi:hypothetical protein